MVAERGWSPERGSREQIPDVHASQIVEQIIEVPKLAEQILDVPVLETVEQSVKLPNTVPQDRIRQRTVELIADILVPHDMEELARFFKVSFLDRMQQSSADLDQVVDVPVVVAAQGETHHSTGTRRDENSRDHTVAACRAGFTRAGHGGVSRDPTVAG